MTITSSQYLDMIAKAHERVMANDAPGAEAMWNEAAKLTGFDAGLIAADSVAYGMFDILRAAGIEPDYMRLIDGYRMLKAKEPPPAKHRFKKRN